MSSGPGSTSTLTDSQKELVSSIVTQMLGSTNANGVRKGGYLDKGATPYKGALTAPFIDPNSALENDAVKKILCGQSAYDFSPEITQSRFQNAVVNPAMNTFNQNIAPSIRESYAGGGAAFNSRASDQIARQLGNMGIGFSAELSDMQYKNQSLAANLADNAANRQISGAQLNNALATQQQQYGQQAISARYNEFLRTAPENNPWLQNALALTGQSQMAVYQRPSAMGPILGLVGAGVGAVAGGLPGAIVGGMIGSSAGGIAGAATAR